jgi:pimeloyl-ACP methyl ester carboxylesterase
MTCLLLNRGVLPNDTPTSVTFVPAPRHAAIRSLAKRTHGVISLACIVWLALISSLGAVEFTARENTVTGTTSDGSPTVLINVKGEETLPGCEREYLTAVTYPTNPPPPGTIGNFTQAVRYFPGRNTITVTSATAKQIRTTTFTIAAPNLRVLMEWKADDLDYDLYVNDVNWTNKVTAEGRLDRDAFAGKEGPGKEEINFKSAKPGSYAIYVNYYSDHGNGGSSPTKITVYLGNDIIFSQTQTITEFENHGGSLAGTGKSVWNVGTVIIHGEKAGGYRVVDDNWQPALVGWRDVFMGDQNKPIVQFAGQMAVIPETEYILPTVNGPYGMSVPVVIGKGASAQFTALSKVNYGSTNLEQRALIGGKFDSSKKDVAIIDELGVLTGLSPGETIVTYGLGYNTLTVKVVDMSVVVDRSGDHKMMAANNETSFTKPFRLWLNDDHDIPDSNNVDPIFGSVGEQYDKNDNTKDHLDTSIKCRRDLEDFAPLKISLSKKELLSTVQDAVVEARWGTGTTGTPSIQVFRNTDDTGKFGYMGDYKGLSLKQTAEPGGSALYSTALATIAAGKDWKSLGTISQLKPTTASTDVDQIIPLIFEAASGGQGWLEIRVRTSQNAILGLKRVYMHLSSIREWYDVYSTDPPSGSVDFDLGRGALPINHYLKSAAKPWTNAEMEKKTVIFIHGYNMQPFDKIAFRETVYKRTWWNGFRGKFISFEWPTTFDVSLLQKAATAGDPRLSYNGFGRSEYLAFLSGDRMTALISELKGKSNEYGTLNIVAHSHGNIVAANALRKVPTGSVQAYAALQAAVGPELYGNPQNVMTDPRLLAGLSQLEAESRNSLTIDPDWVGAFYSTINFFAVDPFSGLTTPNLAEGFLATGNGSLAGASKRINFYNPNDWALGEYVWEWSGISKPMMRMAESGRADETYSYMRQANPPLVSPRPPLGAPDTDTLQSERLFRATKYTSDGILSGTYTSQLTLTPWQGNAPFQLRWPDNQYNPTGMRVFHETYVPPPSFPPLANQNRYFYVNGPSTNIVEQRRYEVIGHIIENRRRAQGRSDMKGPLFTKNVNIRNALWTGYADDSADPKPAAGEAPNGIDPTNKRFCVHRWHSGEFSGTIMEQAVFWRQVVQELEVDSKTPLTIKALQ